MNGRAYYWLGVGSAFAAGVISGVAGVRINLERKLRKEFAEREELMQRAYEQALELGLDKELEGPELDLNEFKFLGEVPPHELKDIKILEISLDETPNAFGEGILTVGGDIVKDAEETAKESINPYHAAVESGGVPDGSISYIDEEDYEDEDGRYKGKIDILINGDQDPIFMMDGSPIGDWEERIGESILRDFYSMVPPGNDPILYVRNHRTDEDYEVVRLAP